MLRLFQTTICVFMICCGSLVSYASSGNVIIGLSDFSEKQIDSVKIWLTPGNNILESGICVENKLLIIRLQEINSLRVQEIFGILKKHGMEKFYLKEEISPDRFYQNCRTFISF